MSDLTSIVRAEDGSDWQRFSNPVRVITAVQLDAVIPALVEIEKAVAGGLTAVGYLAYEAAPAFDAALRCHHSERPLLKFALYSSAETWQPRSTTLPTLQLAPETGKPEYLQHIDQIKSHLAAGDSYQVNYTQRLRGQIGGDAEALFAALLSAQFSPHAVFMEDEEEAVCSLSPELFFTLTGDSISMEPMKGTRPRASDPDLDQQLRQELLDSDKERAENLMIVDMIRNDLGRIAESGSVTVSDLFSILEFPTVWQQVSRVQALTSATLADLFRALFPSASITGAPKRNTMAIITELEHSPRGVYTGSLGVIRPGRRMHFNVGIRTLHLQKSAGSVEYGIGGGIVWDSDGEQEWQEAVLKSRLLGPQLSSFQLLETLAYSPERGIELLPEHLQRLQHSAGYFGFNFDLPTVRRVMQDFSASVPRRLRLTMSSTGQIELQDLELIGNSGPVRLRLAIRPVHSQDRFLRHKTTQRQVYEDARAGADECDDVLLWNEHNELTETTIYNVFLEIDGELVTPDSRCGLLPGTLRRSLLESGRVREATLLKSDLARADRILVGNSVRGLCEAVLL